MNYVKIIASNDFFNARLFVKEDDCYTVLKTLREIHCKTPATGDYHPYRGWAGNHLSVKMRRARIDDNKARLFKSNVTGHKINLVVKQSFDTLNNLKQSFQ